MMEEETRGDSITCMNARCEFCKYNECSIPLLKPQFCIEYVSVEAYLMNKLADHERRLLMLEAKHV